jgi:hypothetical protein
VGVLSLEKFQGDLNNKFNFSFCENVVALNLSKQPMIIYHGCIFGNRWDID